MAGKKNTSKLVLRPITDKNGVRRMTWVKPNGEQNKKQKNGKQEEQRNGGTKEDSSKVQNLGRDAIADRGRTKSEKDSSRKAAKEKLNNREENKVWQSADKYIESVGLPKMEKHTYKPSDEKLQTKISETFLELTDVNSEGHEETETERNIYEQYKEKFSDIVEDYQIRDYKDLVHESYNQLIREIDMQFQQLPVKVEFNDGEKEYKNSTELLDDVHNYNHLWVYQGGDDHTELGSKTTDKKGLTANEKFRAVHDYYGHGLNGFQFGKNGEENAWIEHSKMLSPLAQIALTSETRGQNSVVNYSGINKVPLEKIKLGNTLKKQGKEVGNKEMIAEGQRLVKEGGSSFQFAEQKAVVLPPDQIDFTDYYSYSNKEVPKQLKRY